MRLPASVMRPCRHVGRAHLFHHVFARLHFAQQFDRILHIQQHHARGFEMQIEP